MNASTWILAAVCLVYGGGLLAVLSLVRKLRTSRWPFKLEDRLLREPGEHLRKRIDEFDEKFVWEIIGGIMGVILALALFADTLRKLFGWTPQTAVSLALLAGLVVMGISFWRIVALWRARADYYLGWFGERVVGEQLQLASVQGWRIFHDIPFVNNGVEFNIDHVVVGLGGVFAIETKTRRKGKKARPGFDEHKAYFDGRDLVWPWGEDNHGLEQAERNALWLSNWIRTEIGDRVHVSPILALPGWWLEMKPSRESRLCQVVNPKWLPGLLARQKPVLTPKQIEQIALRLDALCRDVEY